MRKRPLVWVCLCIASAACSRDLQVPTAASDDIRVQLAETGGADQVELVGAQVPA